MARKSHKGTIDRQQRENADDRWAWLVIALILCTASLALWLVLLLESRGGY